MEQLQPDTLETLASNFGLRQVVQLGKSAAGARYVVYRLRTPLGDLALLKPRPLRLKEFHGASPLEELLRANRIFHHLARHGFPVFAPILTGGGSTIATINGDHYALYPYVHGRPMLRSDTRQVAEAGAILGSYHRIMSGYRSRVNGSEDSFPTRFQERLDSFTKNVESLNGQPLVLGIKGSLDYFKDSLLEIELLLLRLPYEDLPRLTIHGDYRCQNILFQGGKLVAVIDFHRSRLEARSLDLAIALADILPRTSNGHAASLGRSFIASYERIQPLSTDEREALPALVEARVAWRAFRRIRRIVRPDDKEKTLRRARKFRVDVGHLRRVRMIRSSWKHMFPGANGQ
jgi:homoserine kinase type II